MILKTCMRTKTDLPIRSSGGMEVSILHHFLHKAMIETVCLYTRVTLAVQDLLHHIITFSCSGTAPSHVIVELLTLSNYS